jgi:hypothetical protein
LDQVGLLFVMVAVLSFQICPDEMPLGPYPPLP